ncbi:PaaI family thioesterase [soil metagenome]
MSLPDLVLDAAGVHAYVAAVWPEAAARFDGSVLQLRPGFVRFRRATAERHVRPGGTIAGPVLMAAVDEAAYALVLAHLGDAALAVTSHLSVEFLRRPQVGTLLVDVEMLKLGRTQVTMSARVHVDDPDSPTVAAATIIYSRALLAG